MMMMMMRMMRMMMRVSNIEQYIQLVTTHSVYMHRTIGVDGKNIVPL